MSDEQEKKAFDFTFAESWEQSQAQMVRQQLGEQVRKARIEMGWSQAELAKWLDRRQAYISEIENGKSEPNATTLMMMCTVLDKRVSFFFPSDWRYGDKEPIKTEELTHEEAALIKKLRQIERGFNQHLAIRVLNTMVDVSKESDDYVDIMEDLH